MSTPAPTASASASSSSGSGSSGSGSTSSKQSISKSEQQEIFQQLATNARYELQQNIVNQVLDLMTNKCYTRCVTPTSTSTSTSNTTTSNALTLAERDEECLSQCGDKYLAARQLVGEEFHKLLSQMK